MDSSDPRWAQLRAAGVDEGDIFDCLDYSDQCEVYDDALSRPLVTLDDLRATLAVAQQSRAYFCTRELRERLEPVLFDLFRQAVGAGLWGLTNGSGER